MTPRTLAHKPSCHLVIFARFPVAGGGKKRLARGVGAATAVRFQRVRLTVLRHRLARDPRWTTWLAVTPDGSGPWPVPFHILDQGRGDLGQRLARAIKSLPPGPVVVVGSDIPGVTATAIADAFTALGAHDAVFGPATDGGYWLIGLRRKPRLLLPFDGVRWSTAHALADTKANLASARIATLKTLDDVDEPSDLARLSGWDRVIPVNSSPPSSARSRTATPKE